MVAKDVDGGDGHQSGHQIRADSVGLRAGEIEPYDEEADGHVQGLPGNLVLVHKRAPMPVDRDETER